MSLLNKLIFLLLLVGFYGPSVAAVDAADFTSCMVFSEAEEDKGDKKDGEEEKDQKTLP